MTTSRSYAVRWKWCLLTSLAMVVLSLIPQIHLWVVRGRDWNGHYVATQGDEHLYSGYLNALMDGRARKNDPFGGRDSTAGSPLPESTFSIQFIPAYAVALPARTFRISASTAFIVLTGAVALLASASVFWLLTFVIGNHRLASTGTIFVMCMGGVVGTYSLFGTFLDAALPALPFLRRYQPAAAFPLFFVFQLCVWCALTRESKRHVRLTAMAAGIILALLIFSYLYLWTAAVAWLLCFGALSLYSRPKDRRKTMTVLLGIGAVSIAALLPYGYMISERARWLDEQHTLIATHRPDPFRLTEILGFSIVVGLGILVFRKKVERTDFRVIFAASIALLPIILYNQQIVSGKTMQVFHFEAFIVNYSILVAIVITSALFRTTFPRRLTMWIGVLSLMWGVLAVALPAKLAFVPSAVAKDQKIPVLMRLRDLSRLDGTLTDLRQRGQTSTLVFSPDLAITVLLPSWTSQGTLLDIGGVEAGTVTREERKGFFYRHLYYSKIEPQVLQMALHGKHDHRSMESYGPIVVFGSERVSPVLSYDFKPIRPDEIEREVQNYQAYINSFSREEALKRPIAYAVIPVEGDFDFTNLDRWYERDAGERVGDYVLYRLKLKLDAPSPNPLPKGEG